MKIQITQEDIDSGVPRSPMDCVIAQAIKRIFKLVNSVIVSPSSSPLGHDTYIYIDGTVYRMPKKTNDFANRFDRCKSLVKPCTLDLIKI